MRGRWPLRAGLEAARAARGGGERDAGLRGKREGVSRAGLLAPGELGQSGLDRRWALAGKGRKVWARLGCVSCWARGERVGRATAEGSEGEWAGLGLG